MAITVASLVPAPPFSSDEIVAIRRLVRTLISLWVHPRALRARRCSDIMRFEAVGSSNWRFVNTRDGAHGAKRQQDAAQSPTEFPDGKLRNQPGNYLILTETPSL